MKFETGFESTDDWDSVDSNDAWYTGVPVNNSNPVLANISREGDHSVRLEGTVPKRNELVHRSPRLEWNYEYWLGLSILIDEHPESGSLILQMRDFPDESQNPFSLRAPNDNEIELGVAADPTYSTLSPGTGAGNGHVNTFLQNTLGEWTDFVFHFSIDNIDGYIDVWKDGVLVYSHVGTTAYNADYDNNEKEEQMYFKIGPYYCCGGTSGDVYYDAVRLWEGSGGSYEAVSPGGLSPNNPASNVIGGNVLGNILTF